MITYKESKDGNFIMKRFQDDGSNVVLCFEDQMMNFQSEEDCYEFLNVKNIDKITIKKFKQLYMTELFNVDEEDIELIQEFSDCYEITDENGKIIK